MATIAIGDIHGNLAALDGLLNQLTSEVEDDDTVVFLADYVDRGPDTKGCIDRILQFASSTRAMVITLTGNHEEALLKARDDYSSHDWILTYFGLTTIASYSSEANRRIRAALKEYGARVITDGAPLLLLL